MSICGILRYRMLKHEGCVHQPSFEEHTVESLAAFQNLTRIE
jgi:hypothetical protein